MENGEKDIDSNLEYSAKPKMTEKEELKRHYESLARYLKEREEKERRKRLFL